MEAIRENVFARLDWQLNNLPNQDEKPHRLIREGYRSLVFDDQAQFDGATYDQIRQHFKALVDADLASGGGYGVRFQFCLVIDEPSLRSIIRNPEPRESCSRRSDRNWQTNGMEPGSRPSTPITVQRDATRLASTRGIFGCI